MGRTRAKHAQQQQVHEYELSVPLAGFLPSSHACMPLIVSSALCREAD